MIGGALGERHAQHALAVARIDGVAIHGRREGESAYECAVRAFDAMELLALGRLPGHAPLALDDEFVIDDSDCRFPNDRPRESRAEITMLSSVSTTSATGDHAPTRPSVSKFVRASAFSNRLFIRVWTVFNSLRASHSDCAHGGSPHLSKGPRDQGYQGGIG